MSQVELPNPDIYLNHLSPTDGRDFEISQCVMIVVLGATIWDILVYIPIDLQILSCSCFRSTIICFFLSRLLAAVYVLGTVIQMTVPLNDIKVHNHVLGVLCVLSVGCSSYLFLRRVHAVYTESRKVRWCFSVLWVACMVSAITIPLETFSVFIPGTHYVIDGNRPIVALSSVCAILFDTSTFLAISYKIASTYPRTNEKVNWRTLLSGKALPRLSRAVLQSGQQYYLIALGMMGLDGIILLIPSVHQMIKSTLLVPTVPLMASMASRIFRNLKLFSPDSSSNNDPTITFHAA